MPTKRRTKKTAKRPHTKCACRMVAAPKKRVRKEARARTRKFRVTTRTGDWAAAFTTTSKRAAAHAYGREIGLGAAEVLKHYRIEEIKGR